MKDMNIGRIIFLYFGGILLLGVLLGIGCLVGATIAVQQADSEISREEIWMEQHRNSRDTSPSPTQFREEKRQKATKLRSIAKHGFIASAIGLILVGLSFSNLFVTKGDLSPGDAHQ